MPAQFRRPAMLSAETADQIVGDVDPATRSEAAHATATALVTGGRADGDAELLDRLVRLVELEGLDTVAALWADCPAPTLPGVLWRLYRLREWTRRDPELVALHYRLGHARAEVADAIAGMVTPPGPEQARELADAILTGVYRGDLAVALERAAAFCRVLATGAALDADAVADGEHARTLTASGATLVGTAEELEHGAGLWRAGRLE